MLKYLFFILIIVSLILPFQVSAAFLSGPIVPCGREGQDPCTLCDFFKMANSIVNFLLQLILIIAPIFILVGGVMILTSGGRSDQVTLGKKIITNTVIGVVIALLSWTIINEILIVLNGSITVEGKEVGKILDWPWNKIDCP
jgi:hypothetical protein